MVLVVIRTIAEAGRASVADTLIVRKSAFASDPGVTEMVTWSVLTTGNASHFFYRNGRVMCTTIRMIVMPMLPLHHADNAPGQSSSKIPGPDAGSMRFTTNKLSMLAIASLWKASASEVLEVIDQVVAAVNKLCWFLDRKAIGVLLTKLTLVKSD